MAMESENEVDLLEKRKGFLEINNPQYGIIKTK